MWQHSRAEAEVKATSEQRRNGLSVAAVENGVVHIRKLTVVRDRGTSLEVSDGVKEGDQVILNPAPDLVEGHTVNSRTVAAPDA